METSSAALPAKLLFRFEFDRFAGERNLDLRSAQNLVKAIDEWGELLEWLFGDAELGSDTAGLCRILPQYPAWHSVVQAQTLVRVRLGGDTGGPDKEISDPALRNSVEELQYYLQAVENWVPAFQTGIYLAHIAALGSLREGIEERFLDGVKSVTALFEFGVTDEPGEITDLMQKANLSSQYLAILSGNAWTTLKEKIRSPEIERIFASEPGKMSEWLQDMRAILGPVRASGLTLENSKWAIPLPLFWQQWKWPSYGAISRNGQPLTVSELDLLFCARFGGVPLVPYRGGQLSIYQWSRILLLSTFDSTVPRNIIDAGWYNLSFPELADPQPNAPNDRPIKKGTSGDQAPTFILSATSEEHPVWASRSDASTRVLVLVQQERAIGDLDASNVDARSNLRADPFHNLIGKVEDLVARNPEAPHIHFIELPEDYRANPLSWSLEPNRRPLSWARIYFGEAAPAIEGQRYVRGAKTVEALIEQARTQYPTLFGRAGPDAEQAVTFLRAVLRFLSDPLGWLRSEISRRFLQETRPRR